MDDDLFEVSEVRHEPLDLPSRTGQEAQAKLHGHRDASQARGVEPATQLLFLLLFITFATAGHT